MQNLILVRIFQILAEQKEDCYSQINSDGSITFHCAIRPSELDCEEMRFLNEHGVQNDTFIPQTWHIPAAFLD